MWRRSSLSQKLWREGKTSEGLAFKDHRDRVLQRRQTLNWNTAHLSAQSSSVPLRRRQVVNLGSVLGSSSCALRSSSWSRRTRAWRSEEPPLHPAHHPTPPPARLMESFSACRLRTPPCRRRWKVCSYRLRRQVDESSPPSLLDGAVRSRVTFVSVSTEPSKWSVYNPPRVLLGFMFC